MRQWKKLINGCNQRDRATVSGLVEIVPFIVAEEHLLLREDEASELVQKPVVIGVTCLFVRISYVKDGVLNRPRWQTTLSVMRHVASTSWNSFREHITLTGDDLWRPDGGVRKASPAFTPQRFAP